METPRRAEEVELVARSRSMRNVLALAERVAQSHAPLLVAGESGTGKERVARYVHRRSPRAAGPFIPVNCGALPEQLLESELFGHARGAFTGADREHKGLFEAAAGGTLLLDEVGEIPHSVQVKLLRVLQDREVRRVGSTESRRIDVRIIAATNRDLAEMVRERTFRKDLYYRLKVLSIEVPPLRERKEDILPLAHSFLQSSCKAYRCGPASISAEALDRLLAHSWPGNARELEHAMERAVVLAGCKPKIEAADLPPEVVFGNPAPDAEAIVPLAELERRHILRALHRFGGSRKETAHALGIATNTLWRRLCEYGVLDGQEAIGGDEGADSPSSRGEPSPRLGIARPKIA